MARHSRSLFSPATYSLDYLLNSGGSPNKINRSGRLQEMLSRPFFVDRFWHEGPFREWQKGRFRKAVQQKLLGRHLLMPSRRADFMGVSGRHFVTSMYNSNLAWEGITFKECERYFECFVARSGTAGGMDSGGEGVDTEKQAIYT